MNVASLNLCQELYELSKWTGLDLNSWVKDDYPEHNRGIFVASSMGSSSMTYLSPAYDLGYLIRKLPKQIPHVGGCPAGVWFNLKLGKWQTSYTRNVQGSDNTKLHTFQADTPEDAACRLAITLFKEGILKNE